VTEQPKTPEQSALDSLMQMSVMADAVVGYRQKLVDGGVPPNIADGMATEYHTTLLEIMKTQLHGKAGFRR
jgi:hypothetical protein